MKILFVVSGNSPNFGINPFIKYQGDSIEKLGHQVDYFRVIGRGSTGYFRNIRKLRQEIRSGSYDLIHAHYTFNGLVALLTGTRKPIIVSYMGSDTYGDYTIRGKFMISSSINVIISRIIQPFIDGIIVKSENIKATICRRKHVYIVPNGVDLSIFGEISPVEARTHLGLSKDKKIVLFMGNHKDYRKNFKLIKESLDLLPDDFELVDPFPVPPEDMIYYYNAANVLALTSYNEGSPNVIKEAMACNIPIISTDVGDIKWLLGELEGHFITTFEPENVAKNIRLAADFKKRTKGRDRIIELGLDAESIAKRIVEIYRNVLNLSP